MARKFKGNAWVFDGILDVDWEICAFETMRQLREKGIPITYEELGKYCMINVDPDFPKKAQKGDFLVARENVGYGHDHDHACMSIKGAGLSAVVCESTNANFFRNSVEHGLPVVECKGVFGEVKQGHELEVDLEAGTVKKLTTGKEMRFAPYPDFLLEMLDAGGLYPYLEQQVKAGAI